MDSIVETTDIMLANPPDMGKLNRAQQATLSVLQQADELDVVDGESCRMGGQIITLCADMTRDIKSLLDPGIAAAFKFHRTLTAQRGEYLTPLNKARDVADLGYDSDGGERGAAEEGFQAPHLLMAPGRLHDGLL